MIHENRTNKINRYEFSVFSLLLPNVNIMRTVHLLERGHVAPRDVHDVDVVAAARAVLRVEVAAVHEQLHVNAGKMNISHD